MTTTRRGFFASLFAAAAAPALARLAPAKPVPILQIPDPFPGQMSIRIIRTYNADADRFISRMDVLLHSPAWTSVPAHPSPYDPGALYRVILSRKR